MANPLRKTWSAASLVVTLVFGGLLASQVAGQDVGNTHHDVVVQQATVDVAFEPDLNALDWVQEDPDGPTGPRQCNHFSHDIDVLAGTFRFDEGQVQTGCVDFVLNLTVPAGVSVFGINFTADRAIRNSTSAVPGAQLSRSMPQYYQLGFVVPTLALAEQPSKRRVDYFDEGSGSHAATTFAEQVLLAPGTTQVTVTWHFQDRGNPQTQQLGVDVGEGLSSTVSRVNFTWIGFPLAPSPAEVSPERTEEDGTRGIVDYVLRAEVPPSILQPEGSFPPNVALRTTARSSLQIAVAEGPTFEGIAGPRGTLSDEDYTFTEGDRRSVVTLEPDVVAAQGPGMYQLHFQSVRALPPPPPPEEPTRIYAFYFILALLPLVAAALAIHQTTLYVRQAEGAYRRTAYPIAVAVGLVVVYYLVLLGYSLFGIGPELMSTLPLVREAVLVYIQLVLLLIMLAAAALAVSRTLMGSMRRDIAERERKEDQLRRSNEELERFAYVASHDLQEPLRKVAGFTALLQKKYAGRLDKDADEIIGYAVDGATRMQMLIKDILAYSRVGSRELQRVQVDAGAVMELVTADLDLPIKESNARVSWTDLPTVRADASQLRQVLQNLVENSIKYGKPGRRPIVRVSGRADGELWHFEVKDNGIGIPADKHEEIFGIFRRLHGQDTAGTGIGLAVAKKAVERHGGKIWVESKPGHGSTFHFTLPRTTLEDSFGRSTRRAADRAAPA